MKTIVTILAILTCHSWSQIIFFDTLPRNWQLFQRDNFDSAQIIISGKIKNSIKDSLVLSLARDNIAYKRVKLTLDSYTDSILFRLSASIKAEKAHYNLTLYLNDRRVATRTNLCAGDVYLITGQSNASANFFNITRSTSDSMWIRSFGMASFSNNMPTNTQVFSDTAWSSGITSSTNRHCSIGAWGFALAKHLVDSTNMPICIINGGCGSTYITQHMPNKIKRDTTDGFYGRMLYRAKKAGIDRSVKALFWYQGESDCGSSGQVVPYAGRFDTIYKAWKEDYPAIQKVYSFQIRPMEGDEWGNVRNFLNIQRNFENSYPDVEVTTALGVGGHDGVHFTVGGYLNLGNQVAKFVMRDFYNSNDTIGLRSPKPLQAFYSNANKTEVIIQFTQSIMLPSSQSGKDSLTGRWLMLGGNAPNIVDITNMPLDHAIKITLDSASTASTVVYPRPTPFTYCNPWIVNDRGYGALAFSLPIQPSGSTSKEVSMPANQSSLSFCIFPNPASAGHLIRYSISDADVNEIAIYNVTGKKVTSLHRIPNHSFIWNGINSFGTNAPSGMYWAVAKKGTNQVKRPFIILH